MRKLKVKEMKEKRSKGIKDFIEEKFVENYKDNSVYKDNDGFYSFTTGGRKRYQTLTSIRSAITRYVNDGWPSSCNEWMGLNNE